MANTDASGALQKLRAITGHAAWIDENDRYEAIQIPDESITIRVQNALARVVKHGGMSDIKVELHIRNQHPENDKPCYVDSVSIGKRFIDPAKLNRAADQTAKPDIRR